MGLLSFVKKLFGGSSEKTLNCVQCGEDFMFEEGEQAFYKERGLQDPKRCPPCRNQNRSRGGRRRRR